MFPVEFARKVIADYTSPGDFVLDPFCGRGTSVFCAGESGRDGLGIEINPVGWLYAFVKINPATKQQIESRLETIGSIADRDDPEIAELPKFYRKCFAPRCSRFCLHADGT
jgi:DNA modification methylase